MEVMSNNIAKLPGTVSLHLTEACNLSCKMCYYWGETGSLSTAESPQKPEVMDFDMLERTVKELAPRKPLYSLFGGEPLMYPRLEELIVSVKEAGSFIDTPTNGTLLEKNAAMLVATGFDSIRVSIDGPREVSDSQRGAGSFDKAMAGIEALQREKQKNGGKGPFIQIIYTVTPENHLSIEQFFLKELNIRAITMVTIQMQNYLTREMGEAYRGMLETELGITSDRYWKGMIRSPEDFAQMDVPELVRQVEQVKEHYDGLRKNVILLPPTFSEKNLCAYLGADWGNMTNTYSKCPVPWNGVDITASGDLAPCHVFYDLVLGNLHDQSFEEVWNGERYQSFRVYMEKNGLMSACHGCCILYLAGQP